MSNDLKFKRSDGSILYFPDLSEYYYRWDLTSGTLSGYGWLYYVGDNYNEDGPVRPVYMVSGLNYSKLKMSSLMKFIGECEKTAINGYIPEKEVWWKLHE